MLESSGLVLVRHLDAYPKLAAFTSLSTCYVQQVSELLADQHDQS